MENLTDNHTESGYDIIFISPQVVTCGIVQECVIVFNAPIPKHIEFFIKVISEEKSSFVRADRVNDTVLKFQTPGNFPAGEANVSVHHTSSQNILCRFKGNLIFEPKVEAIQELLKTVSDPVSFLADALNVRNDNVEVDFKLEEMFRKNKPPNFHLLKESGSERFNNSPIKSSQNPTLLHFAARYNLIRLSLAMVNSPGGNEALNLPNFDGLYPHNLAEQCENNSLAKLLIDAKEIDQNSRPTSSFADEIYEQMSPEIFQHYKEVKKSFRHVSKSTADDGDDDDDDDDDAYCEVYEDMSENGSESNSLSGVGLIINGIDKKSAPKTNPLFEEMRRKNEEKKSTNMVPTTPPRTNTTFTKRCSSSSEHDIYDSIPARNNSTSSRDLYDILPARNNLNNNNNVTNNLPQSPWKQEEPEEQSDDFSIYDTPVSKASENGLYVSASFEQEKFDETYDTLPAPRLSLDFSTMKNIDNNNTFYTDRNGVFETDGYEDHYDVPSRLNKGPMFNPLRNALSNQDLKQESTKSSVYNQVNQSIAYDMGRKGKRHSEPVLQFNPIDKQKLLRGQRSNMPLPVPPRNPIIPVKSPKPSRRPLIPPPLPPQRSPIKR